MRIRHLLLPLALLLALLAPATASAQWAVNGNPVCTATGARANIGLSQPTDWVGR